MINVFTRRLKPTAVEGSSDANETATKKRGVQEDQHGDGHSYVNTNMQA